MPRYVNARRKCGRNLRHQFRGTTERHPDSHSREQITSAACHTAMKDVANDRCLQPFERFLVLQNRQGVEQSLGRMLVHPITGIDDWYVKMPRHEMGRPRRGMTHDNAIRTNRPQSVARVDQRLALLDA